MLTGNDVYYPLGEGFVWTYQMNDGSSYTNTIAEAQENAVFIMRNSMMNKNQQVKKEGTTYLTDSYEEGTMQMFLKDDLSVGNTWEIKFKANGLDNLLIMTVKEVGSQKEVNGTTYPEVALIEAESKLLMNGNLMPLNFFTQYYYAKGIGLVLTTTSMGDAQGLSDCQLG
ncbi:MAG: hypothetical protein HC913_07670 [Microscillaceae bacterium]|nr:hypothetical protein [Microscillaceae bacterium]